MARPKNIIAGPGRRPLPAEQRKILRRIFIKPETDRLLSEARLDDEPLGQTIDRLLDRLQP